MRKPSGSLRRDLTRNSSAGARAAAARANGGGMPWWAWAGGGLALAALLGWVVARVRRGRDGRSPLERAVAELEEALRRARRPQPTGTTLRQLEQLLGGSPDAVGYLRALSAARYGPATALPTPAQRRRLRRALAGSSGVRGRLRAWWALPPKGL